MNQTQIRRLARIASGTAPKRRRSQRPMNVVMYEKPCPYCSRIMKGSNPSIIEWQYALHINKHKRKSGI
jgi:hypothetical protein